MSRDLTGVDAVEAYAMALVSDVSADVCNVVVGGKLFHGWAGTVYGKMVATDRGFRFDTYARARRNASEFVMECAAIVSRRKEGSK